MATSNVVNFDQNIDSSITDTVLEFLQSQGMDDNFDDIDDNELTRLKLLPNNEGEVSGQDVVSLCSFNTDPSSILSKSSVNWNTNASTAVTSTASIDGQNFKIIPIQSGIITFQPTENMERTANPIVRMIPCQLVVEKGGTCMLLVPIPETMTPANQSVVEDTGGLEGLLMPTANGPEANSYNTTSSSSLIVDDESQVMTSHLSTIEEMQALEDFVKKNSTNKKILSDEFEGRGGTDAKNHMNRALSQLMKTKLAGTFSWAGMSRNGEKKHCFKDLTVAVILVDSILRVHYRNKEMRKKNKARLKLENVVKEWLKRQGVASKKAGK